MADCARQIIQDNGFEAKIKLIPKRSTEVTVGSGTLKALLLQTLVKLMSGVIMVSTL